MLFGARTLDAETVAVVVELVVVVVVVVVVVAGRMNCELLPDMIQILYVRSIDNLGDFGC